jgi:tRNA (cmo5U34)-methyltransferase
MQPQEGPVFFDQVVANKYDEQAARLAPLHGALHLLISAIFSDLPAEARILCVGAGTDSELLYLAKKFPRWHFTAVEPSAPRIRRITWSS